jgi:ABC-2 type transport system permease protein
MKLLAFIKKDFLIMISYRFDTILQFGKMFVSVFAFYYISMTFSGTMSPYLERYGGSYFSFVLVGYSVSNFVSVGLDAFSAEIRSAQVEGTLEALLATPTSIYTILVGNSLWSFLEAFVDSIILLMVGIIFFDFQISLTHAVVILFILMLTLVAFLTVGMMSAAFIMIFKQGNPIRYIFGTSSYFLSGIIFPVEVLPAVFQDIAQILPITHTVKALRELLLTDSGYQTIMPYILYLGLFILILSPFSIFFFRYAVKQAKRQGSLMQY